MNAVNREKLGIFCGDVLLEKNFEAGCLSILMGLNPTKTSIL